MAAPEKQYGLILSKKKQAQVITSRPSVFDSGSDSDEEKEKKPMKNPYAKPPKLKTQLEIEKVLEEDPTAYEYDSVYDAMKEKKEAKLTEATVDRKPKYIQTLLKAADQRKKDYERRVERKIQKEREEEGDKFADKEAFVTSAYKKKMQELQEEEEKEKRMDVIEALMDVTKQKDLSGFYRHLLKKQTSDPESSKPKETEVKIERPSSSEDEEQSKRVSKEGPKRSPPSSDSACLESGTQSMAKEALKQLRKSEECKTKSSTVDADSDFSSDSESSSSDSSDSDVQSKGNGGKQMSQSDNIRKRKMSPTSSSKEIADNKSPEKCPRRKSEDSNANSESSSDSDDELHVNNSKSECVKPALSEKDKLIAIFAKRCVGDKFIAAQERYWQRRAQRSAKLAATCA